MGRFDEWDLDEHYGRPALIRAPIGCTRDCEGIADSAGNAYSLVFTITRKPRSVQLPYQRRESKLMFRVNSGEGSMRTRIRGKSSA